MREPHSPSGFRFLEHTTDAEIEAYGRSVEEAFENAGKATEHTMVDISGISEVTSKNIEAEGKDLESLLYSWLEALIALQDTEGLLFSKFSCKISMVKDDLFRLDAVASGEKFDPSRHEQKTAIKAPTYHGMKILQDGNGVTLRFLIDL
ncbi:MAG: archease [Nitrososphaerales archaeon]